MIVRIGMVEKKKGITTEEFRQHWLNVHGPMAAKMEGLYRYHQNHVIDKRQLGVDYPRSAFDVDGFSELWYEDIYTMEKSFVNPAEQYEDLQLFVENVNLVVAVQNIVIPMPKTDKPLLKRMSIINRNNHTNPEKFQREWFEVHSEFVKKMPGVAAYTQNLVIDRIKNGKSVPYEEMPIDGIVELWFEDEEKLQGAFSSENGQKSLAHAKSILDLVTPFLVETEIIIK